MRFWRSLRCLIHGHTDTLQVDRLRIYLRCGSCGDESAGWTVTPTAAMSVKVLRFKKRLRAA